MAYELLYDNEILFDPYSDNIVTDAQLTAKYNNPDYFDFTISSTNSLYNSLKERSGLVELYYNGKKIFEGLITSIEMDLDGNKAVKCSGPLSYLSDTLVRPYSTKVGEAQTIVPDTVSGIFQWYIDQHNKHTLDPKKQFVVGVNQGSMLAANNSFTRTSDSLPNTWSEIKNAILDDLGGFLFVEHKDSTKILNLYGDIHDMNTQIIDFGVNITDFSKKSDTSDQYTAIRPSGYTPEPPEDNKNKKMYPITISDLPDNVVDSESDFVKKGDVIYSVSAVQRYGYKEYAYSNKDINDTTNLLKSAAIVLKTLIAPAESITVKAIDLALYMKGYEHLRVGQAVRIRSKLHDVDEYMMVNTITLDINNPANTEYELGISYESLTGQQSSYLRSLNAGINSALDTVNSLDQATKDTAIVADQASKKAISAINTATDAKNTANIANNTANSAKNVADSAQSNALDAVKKAQAAQTKADKVAEDNAKIETMVHTLDASVTKATADAKQAYDEAKKTGQLAITASKTEYATSDKPTTVPTSGWSTNTPAYIEGQYTWLRVTLTYGDGRTELSKPVLMTGPKGLQGINGISVTSVTTFWQLNTVIPSTPSGTKDPVGWSKTEPTVPDGYSGKLYRTIRTILSNNTATWTAPAVDSMFEYMHRVYNTAAGAVSVSNQAKQTAEGTQQTIAKISDVVTNSALFGDNMIADGGFESNVWWGNGKNKLNDYFRLSENPQFNGKHSLVCENANNERRTLYITHGLGSLSASSISVTPGRTYRLSGYSKWNVAPQSFDANNELLRLSNDADTFITRAIPNTTTSWTETHIDWKCPEDGSIRLVKISICHKDISTIMWDDISFRDVTDAIGTLNEIHKIQSDATQFKSEVSSTYTTKKDFNDLSIGGTNILLDTQLMKNQANKQGYLQTSSFALKEHINNSALNARGGSISKAGLTFAQWYISEFELGTTYTLSFYVDSSDTNVINCFFYGQNGYVTVNTVACSGGNIAVPSGYNDGNVALDIQPGQKQRVWVTWKVNAIGDKSIPKYVLIRGDHSKIDSTIYIYGAKLEKGNRPTDWSPAPDDMATSVELDSSINQTKDNISLAVQGKYVGDDNNLKNIQSSLNVEKDKVTIAFKNAQSVGGQNLLLGTENAIILTGNNVPNQTTESKKFSFGSIKNLPVGMYHIQYTIKSTIAGGTAYLQTNNTPWTNANKVSVTTTEQTVSNPFEIANNNGLADGLRIVLDNVQGSVIITKMKLERGSSATPWSTAPEDHISNLADKIDDNNTLIGSVNRKVDDVSTNFDKYTNTNDTNVKDISNRLDTEIEARDAYIQFSQDANNPMMEMGAKTSTAKMRLTNTQMQFLVNNVIAAYISNDRLNINNADIIQTLKIGKYAFMPRNDGHMTLKYVG